MLITPITNTIPLFTHLGIDVLLNFEHQCVSQIVWSASSTNFHNWVWGYSSSVLRSFYVLDRLNYRYSICDRTYLTTIDETSVTLNRSVVKNLFVLCSTFVLHSIISVWLDPHEQVSSFWEDEQLMLAWACVRCQLLVLSQSMKLHHPKIIRYCGRTRNLQAIGF